MVSEKISRFIGYFYLNVNENRKYRVIAIKPLISPQFIFTFLRQLNPLSAYGMPGKQKKYNYNNLSSVSLLSDVC